MGNGGLSWWSLPHCRRTPVRSGGVRVLRMNFLSTVRHSCSNRRVYAS
jgi:hypothetical protein